jgi:hypothetical protein
VSGWLGDAANARGTIAEETSSMAGVEIVITESVFIVSLTC